MKKILVTGAGGFVGSRVVQQWAGHYELCTFPKGFLATAGEDAVRQVVLQQRPDVILHTAAISDTGYCAGHPEQAYRANVELSVWLARAAAEIGAKLVAFSSDQVYAGVEQSGPLPETIPLKPANVYGQGKLEMEQRVQALCPGAVLLRATWMLRPAGLPAAHPGQPAAEPSACGAAGRICPLFCPGLPGHHLCPAGGGAVGSCLDPARRGLQLWQRKH